MAADQIRSLVEMIGAVLQTAGAVLILILMVLLHRRMRAGHFAWWTAGWLLLTVAVFAASARILIAPMFFGVTLESGHPALRVIALVYQLSKVGALALFLRGVLYYADRPLNLKWRAVLGILLGGGVLSLVIGTSPEMLVRWQAPLATLVLGSSAVLLLRLPPEKRGFGTRVTGIAFAAGALLWASYIVAYRLRILPPDFPMRPAFAFIARYNSFADFFFATWLGLGMVVLLLEDAVRELEVAKARGDVAHMELAAAHQRLRLVATTDPLTGCLNRQGLQEWLDTIPAAASWHGAVLVLDMDNLKPVNDFHGHAAGDAMLRQLATVLAGLTGSTGALCRWGGDEFLLVIPGMSAEGAEESCRALLADAPPLSLPGTPATLRLEASVGAAAYDGPDGVATAIRRADSGMYRHKQKRKLQSGSYPVTTA